MVDSWHPSPLLPSGRTSEPGIRIDQPRLREFLAQLRYPLHLLDFETICLSHAPFPGLPPKAQLPFQFSLHIVSSASTGPVACGYLATPGSDPRPELLTRLRQAVGPVGSLVAYNAGFEKARLRECADALPEHRAWVESLMPRFVDLFQPFRRRILHHPAQRNSASLKHVLPAWTGRDYRHLRIQDGRMASQAFLRLTQPGCPPARGAELRRDLKLYCGQDTLALHWLIEVMTRLAASGGD